MDDDRYALRHIVTVLRRENEDLRAENARLRWELQCSVADHEEAGFIEELALSGASLPADHEPT